MRTREQFTERVLWIVALVMLSVGLTHWSQNSKHEKVATQMGCFPGITPVEQKPEEPVDIELPKKELKLTHLSPPAPRISPPKPAVAKAIPFRQKRVLVRAYTPYDPIDKDSGWTGYTSTMKHTATFPNQWGIAADPRLFPYGTMIRIPGYLPSKHWGPEKFWPVDDTGAICRRLTRKGTPTIEVRFITLEAAREWGEQWLTVDIQDPPSRP